MDKKEENDKNNNNNNKQDNDKNDNNPADNKKETKKGGGIKFFQLLKSKISDITNEVDKKISNIKKEKFNKKEKEKENENKETKSENIEQQNSEEKPQNIEEKKLEETIENSQDKPSEEKNENVEDKSNLDELNAIKKENTSDKLNDQSLPLEPPSINKEENVVEKTEEKSEEKKEENAEEKKDEFSKDELKKLYFRFHTILIENKKFEKFIPELTTIFENLAEFLIQGDKNDPSILELFIQLNFLLDILTFLQKQVKEINIQIIKFFSVLMANLSEKNFNFFLINSDYINQYVYIETEPIDGDYLYYYISFIKALLFKIDNNTLQYFFHEDRYTFPLLVNCLRLYNHPDSMISNTVRNIFLFVLKTGNKSCINYICNLPMISYFVFISCTLRDEIKTLNKKINRGKSESSTILHERICNDILYFQDIFSINIEKVNYILTNCIFHFLVLPTLCNSLVVTQETEKKFTTMDSSNLLGKDMNVFDFTKNLIKEISKESNNLIKECISKELALYIFNLFFKYIKNETFLNALLSVLFLPKIHYKIMQKIKTPIKDLYNYKGDYDPKAKFKLNLEKLIIENYNPSYMRGLITNPYKMFPDLIKIEKKIDDRCKNNKIENNLNMSIPYAFYMDIINDYFSRGDLKMCQEYHQILSEATGIQCGLSYHDDRKSILYLLNKNLKYLKNDFSFEKIQNKYVDNLIYINFMNEFKQCKFLYLLLMYNYLFNQILKNEFVSKELLAHIELLNPNLIHKNKMSDIAEEDDPILQVGDLLKSKEEEKIKVTKIKIITFSNLYKVMYNKDFTLKEFNLYDNKILSKYFYNGQLEYNATIVGVILKYLNRDDVLRPEIYLFLTKLINDLIVYEDNGKKCLLKLRDNHISTIKNIFEKNVEKIIQIINSGKIDENDLIKVFEFMFDKEEKNFFGEYDNIINDFMEDCLFLLNKKVEEKNKTYSDKLELYNSLDIKDLETKIRTYFIKLIFDLYDGIYDGKIKEIQIEEIKDLSEENKGKIKEIVVNNFYKLIIKETKEEKKE